MTVFAHSSDYLLSFLEETVKSVIPFFISTICGKTNLPQNNRFYDFCQFLIICYILK